MATTNFALRTSSEFKEAAQALAAARLALPKQVPGKLVSFPLGGSINSAFNYLTAKGLPETLALVEANMIQTLAALVIGQEILRFMLDHPAVGIAEAVNFATGSSARRVIEASDAANVEADENGGIVREARRGLSAAESKLWLCFDGDITLEAASRAVADCQSNVSKLSAAKGALQRAMATGARQEL